MFQEQYGLNEQQFGFVFGAGAVGLIAATQLNVRLLRRWTPAQILISALAFGALMGLILLLFAATGFGGLAGILVPLWLVLASAGLALPNAPALALSRHGEAAGTAAALLGAVQFGVGALAAPLVGVLGTGAVGMAAGDRRRHAGGEPGPAAGRPPLAARRGRRRAGRGDGALTLLVLRRPVRETSTMRDRTRRWAWLGVLIVGLILYFLVLRTLVRTQNPNFVPALILLGATVVPLSFLTFAQAPHRPLAGARLRRWWSSAFFGGVIGTVVAGTLEYDTLRGLGGLPMLFVAVIEEAAKLIVPVILLFTVMARHQRRLPSDGLIIGVAAGMGFAALETMGYAFSALLSSQGNIGALEETLFIRGLTAPAGHTAWTGLTAGALWALLASRRSQAGAGVRRHLRSARWCCTPSGTPSPACWSSSSWRSSAWAGSSGRCTDTRPSPSAASPPSPYPPDPRPTAPVRRACRPRADAGALPPAAA